MVNKLSRKLHLAKRVAALLLVAALSLSSVAFAREAESRMEVFQEIVSTYSINKDIVNYSDYLEQYDEAARPEVSVVVEADSYTYYEGVVDGALVNAPEVVDGWEGETGKAVLTTEEFLIEWEFTMPETGLYDIAIRYYPVEGKNSEIQRAIFIDGELPYSELALIEFFRVWSNGDFESYVDKNDVTLRA